MKNNSRNEKCIKMQSGTKIASERSGHIDKTGYDMRPDEYFRYTQHNEVKT